MDLYERPLVVKKKRVSFAEAETFLSTSFFVNEKNIDEYAEEDTTQNRWETAIKRDSLMEVQKMAAQNPQLLDPKTEGRPYSVLHLAAKYAATSVLNAYIEIVGINQPCRHYDKTTPLFWAIKHGHLETVRFLLQHGALQCPLSVYGDTTVYLAVKFDRCDILQMLLQMGHDSDLPTGTAKHEETITNHNVVDLPLHLAVKTCNLRAVDLLLEHGTDFFSLNGLGETALYLAIESGQSVEIFERLLRSMHPLSETPSIFKKNAYYYKPLYTIKKFDRYEFLDVALKYINHHDTLKSIIKSVVSVASLEVIQKLVLAGAPIHEDQNFKTDLLESAMSGTNIPVVKYLLEAGADPKKVSLPTWLSSKLLRNRMSHHFDISLPGFHAKYMDVIALHLKYGSDINTVSGGHTALWVLCTDAIVCLALELLRNGADVHKPSEDFVTPLQSVVNCLNDRFNTYMMRNRLINMATILSLFISDWSKEPWTQRFLTNQKHLKEAERHSCPKKGVPEKLVSIFEDITTTPSSLQLCCRTVILKSLGKDSIHKVVHIGLPNRLKEFVLLDDLKNIYRELDFCFDQNHNVNDCPWAWAGVKSDSLCLCAATLGTERDSYIHLVESG